ncbi:hypothetical protein BDZ89DRAFT_1057587 [Hymenopellis radicata]|nr:hypothetical protein BDZ89DRAFT_1057587 [Hymenopellis radicata]
MCDNEYGIDERLYDIAALESDEESTSIPVENLCSAAKFTTDALGELICGVIGGLAVILSGMNVLREDEDVNIAVGPARGREPWREIRKLLETHLESGRIRLPASRLTGDTLRLYVRTGKPWDNCKQQHQVEVDILYKHEVSKEDRGFWLQTIKDIPVFTLPAMFRFKLVAYNTRRASRDLDDLNRIITTIGKDKLLAVKENIVQHMVPDDYLDMMDDLEDEGMEEIRQLILDLFDIDGSQM